MEFTVARTNENNAFEVQGTPAVCVGNLVRNGDFENGLAFWETANAAVAAPPYTHEGKGAAALCAACDRPGRIAQTLTAGGCALSGFFMLSFSVSGVRRRPAGLDVRMWWLDEHEHSLGTAAKLRIHRRAIGGALEGVWNAYQHMFGPAPAPAAAIRLRFEASSMSPESEAPLIDDVIVYGVPPVCCS